MQDSHQSMQAYTNQKQAKQGEQEYQQQFEKGYKLYQLSSELNNAHLQIQKLSIGFQKERREERKAFQRVMRQKDDLSKKLQNTQAEILKFNTIQQAEKTARQKLILANKGLKHNLKIISQRLEIKSMALESILGEIDQLKKCKYGQEQEIQHLNSKIMALRLQQQQNRAKSEMLIGRMKEELGEHSLAFQIELSKDKINQKNMEITEQRLKDISNRLLEAQIMLQQKSNAFDSLKSQIVQKDEQIKGLRLKQDIWLIARQRNREEKMKLDEKVGLLQLELGLLVRKIQACEQNYTEQKAKTKRLQAIAQEYRLQIRKRQDQQIKLQQQCQEIKKKLYVSDIYKQKYQKINQKLKESQERASHFAHISQQYAQQIKEHQDLLFAGQSKIEELEGEVNELTNEAVRKAKELEAANQAISQHVESIKQRNSQIAVLKQEVIECNKKIALLQHQKGKGSSLCYSIENEQMLDHIRKKISIHYESLLQHQQSLRRELQQEVNSAKSTIYQLKDRISHLEKSLNQEKQERELTAIQNERLKHLQFQSHRHHQRKIGQIRESYRSMNRVKSQQIFKPLRKMDIYSCFSYCLFNQFQRPKETRTKLNLRTQESSHQRQDSKYSLTLSKALSVAHEQSLQDKIVKMKESNSLIRQQLKH